MSNQDDNPFAPPPPGGRYGRPGHGTGGDPGWQQSAPGWQTQGGGPYEQRREGGSMWGGILIGGLLGLLAIAMPFFILPGETTLAWIVGAAAVVLATVLALRDGTRRTGLGIFAGLLIAIPLALIVLAGVCIAALSNTGG